MLSKHFKLIKNASSGKWELCETGSGLVLKSYRTREQALTRREIERAIDNAGTVTICHADGTVARTVVYPVRVRR